MVHRPIGLVQRTNLFEKVELPDPASVIDSDVHTNLR